MATCPKCGTEIDEDDEFCSSCGSSLTAKTSEPPAKESYARERDVCFGEGERRRDYSGLVSFGIFLVIVGIIFVANPNAVSQFSSWIEQMSTQQALSRPPKGLIDSATLFFGLIGISNFFLAGVRFMADKTLKRVIADILTGIALILFSCLIYLYGRHALVWQMALAIEVVACGILIILYGVLRYVFPKKIQ